MEISRYHKLAVVAGLLWGTMLIEPILGICPGIDVTKMEWW